MSEFDLTEPGPPPTAPGLIVLGRLGAALARIAGAQGRDLPDLEHVAVVRAGEGGEGGGHAVTDRLVDGGTRLIAVEGGDPAAAFIVIAALLDLEPIAAVGTTPSAAWAGRLVAVRDGLVRSRAHVGDPRRLLAVAGEPELLTGVLIQAALRRTPVLIDGSAQTAAALLVADRLAPGVAAWCTVATSASSPGATAALRDLDLDALLDLGLGAHGVTLALALLREGLACA